MAMTSESERERARAIMELDDDDSNDEDSLSHFWHTKAAVLWKCIRIVYRSVYSGDGVYAYFMCGLYT